MKFANVLPFAAALTTAFVLPSEEVLGELEIEDHRHKSNGWYEEAVSTKDDILHKSKGWYEEAVSTKDDVLSDLMDHLDEAVDSSKDALGQVQEKVYENVKPIKSALDEAFAYASETADGLNEDMQSWYDEEMLGGPHHGPPHHGGPPEHGRPGKRPHHPPHHHKPNLTVYQLISESKYTTKLAKLISEYDDFVTLLNSTDGNVTIFAPTDAAFAKIPEHAPKPSKEELKAILQYHVLPDFYPAGRVLATHTAPTLLIGEHLGDDAKLQRVAFKLSLRGLTVNFFSRIVAVNIFGTNGVIHGVDHLIIPPPSIISIIDLFPGEFSTLELGLGKTGLLEKLNTTDHAGGTFFAPSNFAFQKLGPRINAFLFSKYGAKYLKALLEYHVVPKNTLYSDAYYQAKSSDADMQTFPKGFFHVDLPTLLKDRSLSVDIARFGGFISIKINGFATVSVQDGIAEDGVIHVVRSVLIPPKKLDGAEDEHWDGEELTVEDLKERLEPFVEKGDL